MKRHHDHGNSYKGKHLIGAGLQFRSLVCCHHGKKHGAGEGAQSSILGFEGNGKGLRHWVWLEYLRPHSLPLVMQLLQQHSTYSSKAMPPMSATPYGPVGTAFIQTTTVLFLGDATSYLDASLKVYHPNFECTGSVCLMANVGGLEKPATGNSNGYFWGILERPVTGRSNGYCGVLERPATGRCLHLKFSVGI